MSFSVDLWNGFDIIKEKMSNTQRQIKHFNKLITAYITFAKEYYKNLETLFKENKDTGDLEYPLEQSYINIINIIEFESKARKDFINNITKNITDQIASFLSEPKITLDQIFFKKNELQQNFNRVLTKLANKQETFHLQCKELISFISQTELENNPADKDKDKTLASKSQKILTKLIKSRDEYLLYINEANIERQKFNSQNEELLDTLEKMYKKKNEKFKEWLFEFAQQKHICMEKIYQKEKSDFEEIHSNIDLDKEKLLFIVRNVTKEFPMTKIEFCPVKLNDIGKFVKLKYNDKLEESDYKRIVNSIQNYFKENNINPDISIQSGVSKFLESKSKVMQREKSHTIIGQKGPNSMADKNRDISPKEREFIIMNNVKFIKTLINDFITDGKVELFEDKITDKELNLDEIADEREPMSVGEKLNELLSLINYTNESSPVYIEAFFKILSFLRSKGYYEITESNYYLLQTIFIKILEENPRNDYMLKNILILAQTFYKVEKNEKIYLQRGIKGNDVFNSPETWHRCINYSISLANTDKDLTVQMKKSDLVKKINKEAPVTVLSFLCDLTIFTDSKKVFEKVKNFYKQIYNLDDTVIEQNIITYTENYKKRTFLKRGSNTNNASQIKKEEPKEDERKKEKEKESEIKEKNSNDEQKPKEESKEEKNENKKDDNKEDNKEDKEDKENKENKENKDNKENKGDNNDIKSGENNTEKKEDNENKSNS